MPQEKDSDREHQSCWLFEHRFYLTVVWGHKDPEPPSFRAPRAHLELYVELFPSAWIPAINHDEGKSRTRGKRSCVPTLREADNHFPKKKEKYEKHQKTLTSAGILSLPVFLYLGLRLVKTEKVTNKFFFFLILQTDQEAGRKCTNTITWNSVSVSTTRLCHFEKVKHSFSFNHVNMIQALLYLFAKYKNNRFSK